MKHDEKKEEIPLEEQIPEEYHEFLDIFDEQKADRFPSYIQFGEVFGIFDLVCHFRNEGEGVCILYCPIT